MSERLPQALGRPLSPTEMNEFRQETVIPPEVYEVFNEMIVERLRHGSASFKLKEVTERLAARGIDRQEMFDKGMLDVEPAYIEVGWKVEYDQPGYNETYDAYYIFSESK